jgi:hypothetical protein
MESQPIEQLNSSTAGTPSSKAAGNRTSSKEAQEMPKQQQQQQHEHHALDDFRLAASLLMNGTNSNDKQVQPSSWGSIPLMDIPRIVKALTVAPPPPPTQVSRPAAAAAAGDGSSVTAGVAAAGQETSAVQQHPARPQTKARFRRVIQQTQQAMALLEKSMAAAAVNCNAAAGVSEREGHGTASTTRSGQH